MSKFIFITGGVLSSLGKGIASSSIGTLLSANGYRVTNIKCDPYINVDPGTMNPFQHGEVYVTDDGGEMDLDLGHYERFLNHRMEKKNNITSGSVYNTVIQKERAGKYLGQTVQVIPHITGEIKNRFRKFEQDNYDIVLVEIGGTVGDIESLPFLEAIREFAIEKGRGETIFIHLTLVPYIKSASELKTKPTQHSVASLRQIGISPDMIFCRTEKELPEDLRRKISLFCNTDYNSVIEALDVGNIYEVPLLYHKKNVDRIILEKLHLPCPGAQMKRWQQVATIMRTARKKVRVGIIGKYVNLRDAYKSIDEALTHGGIKNRCLVEKVFIEAAHVEKNPEALKNLDGILVPGGFGMRGIEGKIKAIKFARENNIPFFGICLGLQCAVIEFARSVCKLKGANTTEIEAKAPYPVIDIMEEQKEITDLGGSMRLGAYPCRLERGSRAAGIYKTRLIEERHRHRYEFNNAYREIFLKKGMRFTGIFEKSDLAEIIELPGHKWFLAVQFHPEFKSSPVAPHPLFASFIGSMLETGIKKRQKK
ncbi:MAG: CTP synthase [Spirochaetes bacterium GWF1_41_5]|nr:MAG: CTP synthase [Spirochaetes bacterium GWF1_41_5]HBE01830.1 hypothetical protein [Spirochaetia bacterium]